MKEKRNGYVENFNYITLSVAMITILAILVLYMPGLREFDVAILKVIRQFLSMFPVAIATFVSSFGSAFGLLWFWFEFALICVLLSNRKYLKTFLLIFCTHASFLATNFLKEFLCRERPCGDSYPGFSFPSLHSSSVMCLFGIIIYLTLINVSNKLLRYLLVSIYTIFIALVAISRIWLGVHFLTDVIGGLFMGLLFVNIYIVLEKFFTKG